MIHTTKTHDDYGIRVRVYETGGSARFSVRAEKGPATDYVLIDAGLTEENLLQLRGSTDDGIQTCAGAYDLISEAISETVFSSRLP